MKTVSTVFICFLLAGCTKEPAAVEPEPEPERTIESDIEQMFVLQDVDGDVDIDGVLEAFYHLNANARKDDLPILLRAIRSRRNNFWTRELFSEPIARLGGASVLESLLNAYVASEKEGYDNDGFGYHLTELVAREPKESYDILKRLRNDPRFEHEQLCDWLLEYVEADDKKSAVKPIQYEVGDTLQGMWNFDRRNANLRLTVECVDASVRTLFVTLQSDDLDNAKKEFIAKVGDDGKRLSLEGIARSGSEYEVVSGYSVRDFLRQGSEMKIELNKFDGHKLRGEAGNGTNIFFWSRPER